MWLSLCHCLSALGLLGVETGSAQSGLDLNQQPGWRARAGSSSLGLAFWCPDPHVSVISSACRGLVGKVVGRCQTPGDSPVPEEACPDLLRG